MAFEDYEKLEKVGKGTYGVVYKARNIHTNSIVAMKKILMDSGEEGVPSTTLREISVLRELRNEYIVGLLDIIHADDKLYLVFEFLDQNLKQFMRSYPETSPMPLSLCKKFTFQLIKGLDFCHSRRILHRDLKSENLLIDSQHNLKIADFGLARAFGVPLRSLTHEVVTLWYRSPEVLLGTRVYALGLDIWSVGCIFGEMAMKGHPIFPGDSEIDQIFKIFKAMGTPTEATWPGVSQLPDYKPTFPQWKPAPLVELVPDLEHDQDALDLLAAMLVFDPAKRITARRCLAHKYFKNYRPPSLNQEEEDL